ncbi:type IV secretion system DNA-binding domain-containing protein [Desulfonatronum thiodismutans]|uniref:type IV secretion system DNA-binding domain-containing protein n=1 Tax=Desulfonatronum thiodismutans TaxID=159290 RepID=UPI0004ABE760|nr:type IV secretory system conjugative DNA transfer family protein [Desulfonatronum thiodismutans]
MKVEAHKLRKAFQNRDSALIMKNMIGHRHHASPMPTPLFRFDSDRVISMAEAGHNVIILGGTGRGKTTGLVTPMLSRLIQAGYGGLIIDVKNTFASDLRKLARSCGRGDDIVEIGTHPEAVPVNIIAGYGFQELSMMMESILMHGLEHTKNVDWLYKGVRLVTDCLYLLRLLEPENPPAWTPTLALLSKMIADLALARDVWKYWLVNARPSVEGKEFQAKIESDAFHIFRVQKDQGTRLSGEYDQQLTWQLSNARKVLNAFEHAPLSEKLSAAGGLALDLRKLILDQAKIVLIRFSSSSGAPGKTIARMLKERFYSAVYTRYDYSPAGSDARPVFTIMDEFQDILNLDEQSSLDDFSWFSKAREFKVINVAATQAMSSLYRNGLEHRTRAMLSNFGAKIILQTDDPATDAWTQTFFEAEKPVQKLNKAEAIVAKYAFPDRRLVVSIESVQKEHDRIKARLAALQPETAKVIPAGQCQMALIREIIQSTRWTKKYPKLAKLLPRFKDVLSETASVSITVRPGKYLLKTLVDCLRQARKNKAFITCIRVGTDGVEIESTGGGAWLSHYMREWKICSLCHRKDDSVDNYKTSKSNCCLECFFEQQTDMSFYVRNFIQEYHMLLAKPIDIISYPYAWDKILHAAASKMQKARLAVPIKRVTTWGARLNIQVKNMEGIFFQEREGVTKILQSAARASRKLCVCCGRVVKRSNNFSKKEFVLCDTCVAQEQKAQWIEMQS